MNDSLKLSDRILIAEAFSGQNAGSDLPELAATRHAESDEPDHEVGDLQEYLRAAMKLLTKKQRIAFYRDANVLECLANGLGVEESDLEEIADQSPGA